MQGEPILYLEPLDVAADDVGGGSRCRSRPHPPRSRRADRAPRQHARRQPARASVARRRKTNQRTARENVEQLFDDGSFIEYGSLAIAAQRRRRTLDDLIKSTPGDGLVMGVAHA